MEKEKKEIKISLWTFYVLMTAMVLLITALIIGGLKLYEKSKLPQEAPQTEQIKEESNKQEAKMPNNQNAITNQQNDYIKKKIN